eukprot:TRINITY_DN18699_c0_g1_i1.p2 TRINITY_DN18699_c0_g1~~TRINITY_DN18699_c0_g1_i1.p2  ORF type:complete len:450 (+),score=123.97 TRINITY_DN18699_c0_g1_i1:92-1351(+)
MAHIIPGDTRPDPRCYYKVRDSFVQADRKRTWQPDATYDPLHPNVNTGHRSMAQKVKQKKHGDGGAPTLHGCAVKCDASLPTGGRRRCWRREGSLDLSHAGENGNDGWSTPARSRSGSVPFRENLRARGGTGGKGLDQQLLGQLRSPSPAAVTKTKWITNWVDRDAVGAVSPGLTTQPWCLDTEHVLHPDFRPRGRSEAGSHRRGRGTGAAASIRSNSKGSARERNVMTGHGVDRREYMKESRIRRCASAEPEITRAYEAVTSPPVTGIKHAPRSASARHAPSDWLRNGLREQKAPPTRRRSLVPGGVPPPPSPSLGRAASPGPFPQQPKAKFKFLNPDESPRIAGQRRKMDPAPREGVHYRPFGVTRQTGPVMKDKPLTKPMYVSSNVSHVVSKRSVSSKGRVRTRCAQADTQIIWRC